MLLVLSMHLPPIGLEWGIWQVQPSFGICGSVFELYSCSDFVAAFQLWELEVWEQSELHVGCRWCAVWQVLFECFEEGATLPPLSVQYIKGNLCSVFCFFLLGFAIRVLYSLPLL